MKLPTYKIIGLLALLLAIMAPALLGFVQTPLLSRTVAEVPAINGPTDATSDELIHKKSGEALFGGASTSEAIKRGFQSVRPEWQIESIKPTPISNLHAVQIKNGPLIYSTSSGQYFISGELYEISGQKFVNLAEAEKRPKRVELLSQVPLSNVIIFPAKGKTKSFVNVFTDIDCGYCRKLHNEVPALNRLGIEVRYLAYPRAGLRSASFDKIATAWCADNPSEALTQLKQGKTLATNVCAGNPVAQHLMLGQKLGVTGTPALITPDGQLLPGYMPANELAEILNAK